MMALVTIPIFMMVLGGLFLLLVNFHIMAAVLIFGGISILFMLGARKELEKAQAFRKAWITMKAKNLAEEDGWRQLWRKFLFNTGIFIGIWSGCVTFIGIYFTVCMSVKAGSASWQVLLVFLPMIVAYTGMVALASAMFGCMFIWLWVKTSPFVAVATTSVPFIVIASMAVTMIIHLAG